VEVVPRPAGPAAGLDLGEDERLAVESDEIELAEARAVVAGDDLVAEPLEVRRGEILRRPPEEMSLIR
jgi:hypothetical protein